MNIFLPHVEKLWLNTKLMIGFGFGLVIALTIGFNSIQSMQTMNEKTQQILDLELLGISHIKQANINLVYTGRSLRQMILARTLDERDKARTRLDLAVLTLGKELSEARTRTLHKDEKQKFDEFDALFDQYKRDMADAIAHLDKDGLSNGNGLATAFLSSERYQNNVNAADDLLTVITKVKEKGAQDTAMALERMSNDSIRITLILLLAGVMVGVGVCVLVGHSIRDPIDQLRISIEGLAKGKVDDIVPYTDYANELGIVARSIKTLQDAVRESEDTRWVKAHAGDIANSLRQAEDTKTLAQSAISQIAPVLKAGHGAVYVINNDNRLILLGSYGYRERKNLSNGFAMGDGLVGQCAMEKAPITLTAPKDYIQINSGLGEAPPACISVLPILHNARLLGVLEVASFQQFTVREIALLDALMPTLATSMEIMDRNQRTRDLLASTQEQAERMEKQAAQLEEQTVEMEAQQAELIETENWFRSIIETAPQGMLVVNETHTIVLANARAEALFDYASGDLTGSPLSKIMPTNVLTDGPGGAIENTNGILNSGQTINLSVTASQLPARGRHGRCVSLAMRLV